MVIFEDKYKEVQDFVSKFSATEVQPIAHEIDANHEIPKELYQKIADNGFFGIFIPSSYGGAEMDYMSYAIIVEELSKACASTGVLVSAHNSLCVWPILTFGTEEQKSTYLPRLAQGEVGCFMLSEPISGSDAGGLICTAMADGDSFIVNGVKNWITNGKQATIGVLFAKTEKTNNHKGVSAFIVDMKTPGITVQKCEEKLGICGSSTAQIIFENVKIPKSALLLEAADGFKVAMKTLDGGRIGIAAQALGISKAAYHFALKYSKEREAFGKKICDFQAIQFKLAQMALKIEASTLLIQNASKRKDQKMSYSKEASMAKLFSSNAATWITNEAIQVLGGNGYSKEYPVERHFRDAKITEIYEGTSEIQHLVIAASELKEIE